MAKYGLQKVAPYAVAAGKAYGSRKITEWVSGANKRKSEDKGLLSNKRKIVPKRRNTLAKYMALKRSNAIPTYLAKSQRRYETTGGYRGRIKASRKGTRSTWDVYNKYGVVDINEIYGSVSDQTCVYIVNEVINTRDAIYYMIGAMLRKLIEMAGGRVTGNTSTVFSTTSGSTSSTNYIIRLQTQNSTTGATQTIDYSLIATTQFQSIVEAFRASFESYCAGYGKADNDNCIEPVRFILINGSTPTTESVQAEMYFNETFIDIKGKSEMKVQNRTLATGGSADAENINNNPLQGRSYVFRGVPKPKANAFIQGGTNGALYAFERLDYPNAVSTFGATSTAALDQNMREPPLPSLFWNVKKSSKVRLEPGAIKSFYESDYLSGNVLALLKKMRLQTNSTGLYINYSAMKLQMLAFEDVINANAEELISIQYEIERTIGVKCYVKQKKYYKTEVHIEAK